MGERDHLLAAMIEEVLGPRGGPQETLGANEDPRNEYVTGVLAPRDAQEQPDIDSENDLPEGDDSDDDAESDTAAVPSSAITTFSPALNPKSLPHSIGLSFAVETAVGARPTIEICATWARYIPIQPAGWQRQPDGFLSGPVDAGNSFVWDESQVGPGVSLYLYARTQPGAGRYRISIYLVNTTAPANAEHIETPELLFQPQVRIHLADGTNALPIEGGVGDHSGDESNEQTREDGSLALLYRDLRPLARGHLCGATWRDVDPERPHGDGQPLPHRPPYFWIDCGSIDAEEQPKFSPAHIRTELLPTYAIESPDPDWRSDRFPILPVLDPEQLAEIWQPADVRAALEPLTNAYAEWIDDLRHVDVTAVEAPLRAVAERHLSSCDLANSRMREGINLLVNDEDARLAFCFANRAIALQSTWANQVARPWRPFQLGFILLNLVAIAHPTDPERDICDLLWFPTGGGKTEAYLGLAAFTLALRRRRSLPDAAGYRTGGGVGVLSRYTLRLLTIQQFRRALGVVTACEFLRVDGLNLTGTSVGWRPRACPVQEDFLWGAGRFSTGLWVGGNVTPNGFHRIEYKTPDGHVVREPGAFDLLDGAYRTLGAAPGTHGEPAQVISCPACHWIDSGAIAPTILAIPEEDGLTRGRHRLHLVVTATIGGAAPLYSGLAIPGVVIVHSFQNLSTGSSNSWTLSFEVEVLADHLSTEQVDRDWWGNLVEPALRASGWADLELTCVRPSRPGYFFRQYQSAQNRSLRCDFDIYCPNPECTLNSAQWAERVPVPVGAHSVPTAGDGEWQDVSPPFRVDQNPGRSSRIPIPAFTVDDQIYHRCPSLLVATVDKFARLAHEAKAGSLFGVVNRYHAWWGYYRSGSPPAWANLPPGPRDDPPGRGTTPLHRSVQEFAPPDLVLQDELHLIEGPLGSMVGLYETAIDLLSERLVDNTNVRPKYIASTATVRQAETQVRALFDRSLAQFPPPALSAQDTFFARTRETHPLDANRAGRLYVGIAAPGKGAQTPIVRIWSGLLQEVSQRRATGASLSELDGFWTLVGYFNAIRELAGARALYRQDIPEWMRHRVGPGGVARSLSTDADRPIELSSRTNSVRLPGLLDRLSISLPDARTEDAVQATSMFGTGVDVTRLGLMVVHGQPKTTAAYIQATGRVGRNQGNPGLVVTFLRATRPRDLDHYEFFTAYHRAIYGYVEPITVAPFSPRARERGLGPLAVILLRQARELNGNPVPADLRIQQRLSGAIRFRANASQLHADWAAPAVQAVAPQLETRACHQPLERRPVAGRTALEAASALDVWRQLAQLHPGTAALVYHEPTLVTPAQTHVILGDPQHQAAGLHQAFRNAPNSLREVEATTRFQS